VTNFRDSFSLSRLKSGSGLNVLAVLISGAALFLSFAGHSAGLPFDAAWAAIALCGAPIVAGAARALICKHDVKADLLVSMAIIASILIEEYFAAGEVALIMQVGTLLEDYTAGRARSGIEKLVKLTPQTARVKRGGAGVVVPADQVAAGDTLVVLAGETIPADGVITAGETTVDQSVMTGESLPVDKKAGDEVTSGTLNQFGTFEMLALRKHAATVRCSAWCGWRRKPTPTKRPS
jgi:cation transport ATPase